MRLLVKILIGLAALAIALAAFAAWKIGGPRNLIGLIRYDQRQEGRLRVGDTVADVQLVALDGTPSVRLKQFVGGKPLVLVFGSYT
jgi:hypothetical protein